MRMLRSVGRFLCANSQVDHYVFRYRRSMSVGLALTLVILGLTRIIPPTQSSPQSVASPVSWMTQLASGSASGLTPKLNVVPRVQLDFGTRYYKTMIDGMKQNFKQAIIKVSEKPFTMNNVTSRRPIVLSAAGINGNQQQQTSVSVHDLQVEGISSPKVSKIYVSKKKMKLHVNFVYKKIRVSGKCSVTSHLKPASTQATSGGGKILMEATYWNTSWSASIMDMIGTDHFNHNKVYTSHAQQRLTTSNLEDCPSQLHEQIKSTLVELVKSEVDARLFEIMESVIMTSDPSEEEASASKSATLSRGKRAAGGNNKLAAKKLTTPKPSVAKSSTAKSSTSKSTTTTTTTTTTTATLRAKSSKPTASTSSSTATKTTAKPTAAATTTPKKKDKRADKLQASSTKRPNPITSTVKDKQVNINKNNSTRVAPKTNNKENVDKKKSSRSASPKLSPATRILPDNNKRSTPQKPQAVGARSSKVLKRTKRQTPCQQGEELDDYVDQLFRFGTKIVRAMEPVALPNATVELPDYNLKIFLYDGKGTRAYKFRRSKSAWVFCGNETVSLGLTIEVEELRVAYKYRVIGGTRLLFDGDLEAKLSPKIQAQFSQKVQDEDSEDPVQQRVDRLRVFRLGKVHVIIRGLGNLTQSLSMMINSYLNDNQEELQPTFRMVEGDGVKMINKMLSSVNVPLLSVV